MPMTCQVFGGKQEFPFNAQIRVACPIGSTLTCQLGNMVYKVIPSTNSYTFSVHIKGTWTIKAVLGDKTIVENVEVTSDAEIINVELIKAIKDLPLYSKLKFSSGKTFVLQAKNVYDHEPNSVTLCSEYIIEDAPWGEKGDILYSESNIHKNIMPKYYNELSELEKSTIIYRSFNTYQGESGPDDVLALYKKQTYKVESFFYAPDIGELSVMVKFIPENADGGDCEWWGAGFNYQGVLGYDNYSTRKRTFSDGVPGRYFTTTTRCHTYNRNTTYSVATIDSDGSMYAVEETLLQQVGGVAPFPPEVRSGVVPFCDIKGNTIVTKDLDGYYQIIGTSDTPNIFGIQRDITSSSLEWTRTDDAVGMSATASNGSDSGRSSFDYAMPWKGIVRETLSTGDVMVKIPKFYFRRYREGNIEHIQITEKKIDGFELHPLFNNGGVEREYAYIGAYETSSNNKSVSGATPTVSQTRATMRDNARSKGTGWGLVDIAALSAAQMLYLVEYATNDSQTAIGRGYVDGNSAILQTGTCDNVPGLTGVPTGTKGKVDVVYRGIEGIWGNIREWIDGINFNNSEIWVCNNPSLYADSTSTNYTRLSYNLINNTGYITDLGIDTGENKHVMLPFKAGGTNSTYYPDYVNGKVGGRTWRVLNVGGGLAGNSDAGLFCTYGDFGPGNTHNRVGSRLLYIPQTGGGGAEPHPEITNPEITPSPSTSVTTSTSNRKHNGGSDL